MSAAAGTPPSHLTSISFCTRYHFPWDASAANHADGAKRADGLTSWRSTFVASVKRRTCPPPCFIFSMGKVGGVKTLCTIALAKRGNRRMWKSAVGSRCFTCHQSDRSRTRLSRLVAAGKRSTTTCICRPLLICLRLTDNDWRCLQVEALVRTLVVRISLKQDLSREVEEGWMKRVVLRCRRICSSTTTVLEMFR